MGALPRGLAACGERGQPTGGSAAPGGLPPVGRGRLPPRSRRVPLLSPAGFRQLPPSRQVAIPLDDFRVPACDLGRARHRPGAPWRALEDVKKVLTAADSTLVLSRLMLDTLASLDA